MTSDQNIQSRRSKNRERASTSVNYFLLFPFSLTTLFACKYPALAEACSKSEVNEFRLELLKEDPSLDTIEKSASCPDSVQYSAEILHGSQKNLARFYAAYSISISGQDNIREVLDGLLFFLKNEEDSDIRRYLIISAGNSKTSREDIVAVLIETLKEDRDGEIRGLAAIALSEVQGDPEKILNALIESLKSEQPDNQEYVYEKITIAISSYGIKSEPYLNDLKTLVQSSRYPANTRLAIAKSIAAISLSMYEKAVEQDNGLVRLIELRKVWLKSRQLRLLSVEFDSALKAIDTSTIDVPEMEVSYREIERYKALIDGRQRDLALSLSRQSFAGFGQVAVTHGLVWLALIFAYPRSPMVQTAFFWNPRIRRILGFPYVTGALKWVPFFRNILFIPFRDALRSDANLDLFKGQTYFADLDVKADGWSESQPINQVIPKLKGQVVLQGESGSGKSMFLRYLLSRSSRIAVYLPAQKCSQGVIAAIQAKLYGQAQDADFLRDLIYSGAIDIYIDGLNEVTPDTRASIKDFVEKNFKGNIILTTQPLEWQPPGQVYHLCPLGMDQIKDFLRQHQPAGSPNYAQACDAYLAKVQADLIDEAVPADEKAALQQSLANPMDLTVVAQLIANQKQPDLLRLREQQYFTMAEDYQRIYLGRSFPLGAFAELAYRLRLESQVQIPAADFGDELLCLERHKMVVRRQRSGEGGNGLTQWFFRHEKMADFFVAQSFLQATDDRQTQHFADSRFRGVYLLLATLLPESPKMALREQLIQYAVRNNDHVLSDAFIRLVGSPNFLQP